MKNSLDGRLALMGWDFPQISYQDFAVTDRQNGTLAGKIDLLWDRGMAPFVEVDNPGGTTSAGLAALALTIQEQGAPVHVLSLPKGNVQNDIFFPDSSMWFYYAPSDKYFPILPLATAGPAYYKIRTQLESLKSAGVTANGVWSDYEGQLTPWNGTWNANKNPDYPARAYYAAAHLDPNLIDNQAAFWEYALDLNYTMQKQSQRQAMTDTFGASALSGFYGAHNSSVANPYYDLNGNPYTTAPNIDAGDVAQPILYANNTHLPNYFTPTETVTQSKVDDIHWFLMMRSFSSAAINDPAGGRNVPWVSSYIADNSDPRFVSWGMSDASYNEFLKHVWLRGADGMSVFNPYSSGPTNYQTAPNSFKQLELARSVMDEMLNYREFLDGGTPMTFAFDSAVNYNARTVWSGLTRASDAIVQVTSIDGSTTAASFSAFGQTFNLPAKANAGATYYITSAGDFHRVDPRPFTAQVQFENAYLDSSVSQLTVATGKYPTTITDPTFSTNVPGQHIRSGVYGYLVNAQNTYSLQLSRGDNQSQGNWVHIPNTSGVFDQPSFTAELFVNLLDGNQDFANIIGKVVDGSTFDWKLNWRSDNRLEISLRLVGDNNTSWVWLRTVTDTRLASQDIDWHHLALTYDNSTDELHLFLDQTLLPWEFVGKNAGVGTPTLGGILPSDIYYRAESDIRLGFANRSINALVDEFRFSPEVLDPYQFLHVNPEPNTLTMLAFAALGLLRRRKHVPGHCRQSGGAPRPLAL